MILGKFEKCNIISIFSSTLRSRSRSGLYLSDDYNSPRMNRSRSMSRLHLNTSQDLDPGLNSSLRSRPFELSLRHLKDNLDDSENRRIVLVHKLKEAQETLEVISCINFRFQVDMSSDCIQLI